MRNVLFWRSVHKRGLTENEIGAIVAEVLQGLHYLHSIPFIHRGAHLLRIHLLYFRTSTLYSFMSILLIYESRKSCTFTRAKNKDLWLWGVKLF